jgi:hypothetical protein
MASQLLGTDSSLRVPLSLATLKEAELFALEQESIDKRKQVFGNAVAVNGVADWLRYDLGFDAHVPSGDFYDPLLRSVQDVADLVIDGVGKVECRAILDNADSFILPPETHQGRIAYVVVRLPEELVEIEILGFLTSLAGCDLAQPIAVADLLAPSELPMHLRVEARIASLSLEELAEQFEPLRSRSDALLSRMIQGALSGSMGDGALMLKSNSAGREISESVDDEDILFQEKLAQEVLRRLRGMWSDG